MKLCFVCVTILLLGVADINADVETDINADVETTATPAPYNDQPFSHRVYENPDLFEGDIEMPVKTRGFVIAQGVQTWPKGIVYYVNKFKNDPKMTELIRYAMRDIESKTCIRFKEVQTEGQVQDYVVITRGPDGTCKSAIGKTGRRQELLLGKGCEFWYVINHELGHALGLYHEHTRSDRDKWINIDMNNVKPGEKDNFIIPQGRIVTRDYFDFESIMLYDQDGFSKDGKSLTIVRKDGKGYRRQKEKPGMSKGDVASINYLYGNCQR